VKKFWILGALLLTGCAEDVPRPVTVIQGTVVSCNERRAVLTLLLADGHLKNLDVTYTTMPGCGSFVHGGVWEIHVRKSSSASDEIVSIRKIREY
jgi:hypothetical protein